MILQVLTPIYEEVFSDGSRGFRPGRSAHGAVRTAEGYVEEGNEWVVDLDIEKYFDRVNHDILMYRIAYHIHDKRVLKVIRAFLTAGVLVNGLEVSTEEGTPRGGPLSPLLANILLDALDKELDKRGHKYVRYADDCNIYVKSRRAGERVMANVREFLEKKLGLKMNEQKSGVDRANRRKFLGFTLMKRMGKICIAISRKSRERFKEKIRKLTNRNTGTSMENRLERLNRYLRGWMTCYRLSETLSIPDTLDQWIRRRLRVYFARGKSSKGGADVFLDCYAARFKLLRYSRGLFAPSEILILFSLYQYRYPLSISMNSSTLTPVHVLL